MTTEQRAPMEAAAAGPTVARMVIGGESVDAADGQTFDVVNPAIGRTIATAPLGGREDVDRAVAAAQKAFEDRKGWASWAAGKRGRSLAKLADLIKKSSEELAWLESRNVGKPLTAIRLGELALEAGIPAGVLNVVTGPGGTAGASIAAHPGIGKVAFTGETTTGQEIMRLASGNVKKISLELGGKSPNIVFADADLERFAKESPYSVFDNAGQDCCARSRIIVERAAHEKVVELFADATRNVKVGDPADESTEVGSLVSQKQRDRVKDYIEIGQAEGATIVVGGTA